MSGNIFKREEEKNKDDIIYSDKPSWWYYIPTLIAYCILVFPAYYYSIWKIFCWGFIPFTWLRLIFLSIPIMFFLILLLTTFIKRLSHTFIVTTNSVMHKKGLFLISNEKSNFMIPFSKLQWIKPEQNRMEQILGIGRILFETASDKSGPDMVFFGIRDPYFVAEKIQKMISKGGGMI